MMPSYTIAPDGRSITCHRCGLTSHNINDVQRKFCGHCNTFHDDGCGVEYDCAECGRHIWQFGGPVTGTCAACIAIPRWFNNPEIAARIDPDMKRNPKRTH